MSISLSTITEVYDLVQRGLEIYNRVKELPQKMAHFDKRMRKLTEFLSRLESFITGPNQNAYLALFPGQKESMNRTLKDIKTNVAEIFGILDRYEKGIISKKYDITFRVKAFSQIWAATIGGTPEKIEAILEDIDKDREDMNQELIFMIAQGNQILVTNTGKGLGAQGVENAVSMPQSPSPVSVRRNYRIIFVDPYNVARSLVAEAATKLIKGWTLQTHGDWRIEVIHSAGFFLKNDNGLVDLIDNLDYTYKSFKQPWEWGLQTWVRPKAVALASLFDNPSYPYPWKKHVQAEVASRTPRGLGRGIFKNYDFIIVFTNREQDNMVKLKEALLAKEGRAMVPRGKGMIVPLGTFLPKTQEILDPSTTGTPEDARRNWNKTSGTLKVAIKAFLTKEMGWTKPESPKKQ